MKKKKSLLLVIAVLLVISVVGISFSAYIAILRGKNENTISTAATNIIYTEQNDPLEQIRFYSDENGPTSFAYYEFNVFAGGESDFAINYAVYLEEDEDNTLDKSLIHYYLSDSNNLPIDSAFGGYSYTCNNYSNSSLSHPGSCLLSDTLYEVTKETAINDGALESSDTTVSKVYYSDQYSDAGSEFFGYNNNLDCGRVVYFDYGDGNYVAHGRTSGTNCSFGNVITVNTEALPLVGSTSNKNYLGLLKSGSGTYTFKYNLIGKAFENAGLDNLLYVGRLGSNGSIMSETQSFRLRYWISQEEITNSTDIDEGIEDLDGSITARVGEDATFKFKIGIFANTASPS